MNGNLGYHQFKMFYGAQDLQKEINYSFDTEDNVTSSGTVMGAHDPYGPNPWRETEPETLNMMWRRKTAESKKPASSEDHGAGVHESISAKGFKGKLNLDFSARQPPHEPNRFVEDGHHRVAAAADIERTTGKDVWIPVNNRDRHLPQRLERDRRATQRRPQ